MKKLLIIALIVSPVLWMQGQKQIRSIATKVETTTLSSQVPAEIQGGWMYGNFSMTEYWTTSPSQYLGNALTFAIAFQFNADGTYTQYFTSSSVLAGIRIYHQSVSKGKMVIDSEAKTITTYPVSGHYKRTKMGKVEEDRDLLPKEINGATTYHYNTGVEPSGTNAIYLTLQGTQSPLTFFKKH